MTESQWRLPRHLIVKDAHGWFPKWSDGTSLVWTGDRADTWPSWLRFDTEDGCLRFFR